MMRIWRKKVPKLKGQANFNDWKAAITRILEQTNLWDYVNGKICEPKDAIYYSINGCGTERYVELERELCEWKNEDNKAIQMIIDTVPGWLTNLLKPEHRSTSKALFHELQTRYQKDDYEAATDWRDCHWDGASDMSEFLDDWTTKLAKCFKEGLEVCEVSQARQLAYAVQDKGNDEVHDWSVDVFQACSEKKVSPLHVLMEQLIGIFENEDEC